MSDAGVGGRDRPDGYTPTHSPPRAFYGNPSASSNSDAGVTVTSGHGYAEATEPTPLDLKLDCGEFGPDVPIVSEQPGSGVPRIASASTKELPAPPVAYESEGKLWLVSSTDQRRKRLAVGKRPRWMPDGRSLVFVSELGDRLPRLVEASVDCSSARVLSRPLVTGYAEASTPDNPYESGFFYYSVSPNGNALAFNRSERDHENLYLLDLVTGTERLLAQNVAMTEPAWFPDAQALAYIASENDPPELMRLELASGQSRKLASAYGGFVAVTPDTRLLFHSAVGSSNTIEDRQTGLYQTDLIRGATYGLKGSQLGPGAYGDIRISPNGGKVAVSWSLWTGNGPGALRDHGIALFTIPKTLPPPSSRAQDPQKGRRAFDPKNDAIIFAPPEARNLSHAISGARYSMGDPSWAPDSRHIVFGLAYCGQDFVDCRSQVVAMDSAAANPRLIFLANGSEPVWSP